VALSLAALAAAGLAFAQNPPQRPPQSLPIAPGYRGSIGPAPQLDSTAPERAEVAGRVYRSKSRGSASSPRWHGSSVSMPSRGSRT
jgi:hypothetical protein